MKRLLVIVLACCATAGCVSNPWTMRSRAKLPPPHDIAVFMDGTANDFESRTNVMKLNLILSEDAGDTVDTFYVEGIGAKDKLVGAATGWGFRYRIKQAYAYLLMNHHERDRVFLFGFSRGAYSARVLASLLHYGGLPVEPVAKEARARQIADVLFDAYKGDISDELRRKRIAAAQARLGLEFRPATVEFMGLWDTVESMGLPDEGENVEGENRQYADQLCNVRTAAHAMSLDDNRAWDFTPILLTRRHLLHQCTRTPDGEPWTYTDEAADAWLDARVDEVWFSGAHSDVGGGYEEGRLSGVSLNWMLAKLRPYGIAADHPDVNEDLTSELHDPQEAMKIYRRKPRSLERYALESAYNGGKLKLHPTVLSRLSALRVDGPIVDGKRTDGLRSPAGLGSQLFKPCFRALGGERFLFDPDPDLCALTVAY